METIKDKAQAYEPPQTKNITELSSVSVDIEVKEKEFTREDQTTFKVNVIEINGEDYRVPNSVLKSLKVWLVEKPEIKNFKVTKEGEGLKTTYTLMPLEWINNFGVRGRLSPFFSFLLY